MARKWLVCCSMMLGLLLITHLAQANSVYYGPTTNQDHFWQVVDKFRPNESITREQMAVAILQANPTAFSDGNVNALRNGQMLRMPTADEVQQINAQTAAKAVQQMNQTWQVSHPQPTSTPDGFKTTVRVSTPSTPTVIDNNDLAAFSNDNWGSTAANNGLPVNRTSDSSVLQQQIQNTQQQLQQLQQQVNLQVGKLVQQNLLLQAQLANNSQVIEWVLQQMQKNNTSNQRLTPPTVLSGKSLQLMGQPLPSAQHSSSSKFALGMIVVVMLVLLGVWVPRAQRSKNNLRAEPQLREPRPRHPVMERVNMVASNPVKPKPKVAVVQDSNEYDFLGGQEGMAAKLNIARVYLDMEDFVTADKYLLEVMKQGNEEQRRTAERMHLQINDAMVNSAN
jgi:FimV-like protein